MFCILQKHIWSPTNETRRRHSPLPSFGKKTLTKLLGNGEYSQIFLHQGNQQKQKKLMFKIK